MTAGTPSKTTAAAAGAKGGAKVARNRPARQAAKPAAKATWFVGKTVAKRKAKQYVRRYGDAASTAWSLALIYGPMTAETLGLIEQPKPRRRFRAFLAGTAIGAGLMHIAGRNRTA
jgi:hypothetical protein